MKLERRAYCQIEMNLHDYKRVVLTIGPRSPLLQVPRLTLIARKIIQMCHDNS